MTWYPPRAILDRLGTTDEYPPACGTGGMLTDCVGFILSNPPFALPKLCFQPSAPGLTTAGAHHRPLHAACAHPTHNRPMEQFKASEEDWQQIENSANILQQADIGRAICELRDRVAALEAERVAPEASTTAPTQPAAVPSAVVRAEQGGAPEPEPEPADFQTLHGIALDMVEALRPIVIPEILNTLRRAIREPMAEPTHLPYISGHGLVSSEIERALVDAGWPEPEPDQAPAGDGGLMDTIAAELHGGAT